MRRKWTERSDRSSGRVTGRESIRLLPDSFMADPNVPPQEVAALVGYQSDANELFEITVTVLGYHSSEMGEFINPRVPPAGGSPVYIASDELLTQVLSKRKRATVGSAHLGSLLSRRGGCSAGGAGCARLHKYPSGHHRQHRQRQELSWPACCWRS